MIIVIVDKFESAIGQSALARQKYEDSVVIAANQYASPYKLLKEITKLDPRVLLFSFRSVFIDALSTKASFALLNELHKKAPIGILIPDYLEIENSELNISAITIDSIDFLLTTNLDLEFRYRNMYGDALLVSTYHDLVDVDQIRPFRHPGRITKNQIAWVGNSNWGFRQGKKDHKGLREVVNVIKSSLAFADFKFEIIDSAKEWRDYSEVIETLGRSSILLHPSKSEGTGLPILEAALLGCFPITTDVGIARELLGRYFSYLIVDRKIVEFERAINLVNALNVSERLKLIEVAEQYLAAISKEKIPQNLISKKTTHPHHLNLLGKIHLLIKWNYRFFIRSMR